jgi:hypothetical protein
MPYKDPDLRRMKAREYTAEYRVRQKLKAALIVPEPRFCKFCNESIVHKRIDAKFCSKEHKRMFADKKRDFAKEYQKNKIHKRNLALKYYYADLDASRLKQRQRQKNNLGIFAANAAKRRSAKLLRTPKWLSEDDLWMMKEAYQLANLRTKMFGFKWHVDHVVPLQGNNVSGLHVPWNLQVIPGALNISKLNSFEV